MSFAASTKIFGNALLAMLTLNFATMVAAADKERYQPRVLETRPAQEAKDVTAAQIFLLKLSRPLDGAPDAQCNVEGIRSGIPVEVINGKMRDAALAEAKVTDPENWLSLRCKTRFPDGARVSVIWRKPDPPQDTPRNPSELWYGQGFGFTARSDQPFSLDCARENEGAGCNPVTSVALRFPVTLDESQAKAIYLKDNNGKVFRPEEQKRDNYSGATEVVFPRLPPATVLGVHLPPKLKDYQGKVLLADGRTPPPYSFKMADYPPLVKFAADFGIIERNAEPALPITLRNVEAATSDEGRAARLRTLHLMDEVKIIAALREVQGWQSKDNTMSFRYDNGEEGDEEGGSSFEKSPKVPKGADSRGYSMLATRKGIITQDLPKPLGSKPMEVVGLPLPEPGFYLMEAESQKLGRSLLDQDRPMYVRTAALVSNLATHIHYSTRQAMVWVTTLDQAKPVQGATITLRNCKGKQLGQGKTDAQGVAVISGALPGEVWGCPLFAFARQGDDLSFARSDWTSGIETWRFRFEGEWDPKTKLGHTVLARNLLRPDETVHMKHYLREALPQGLAYPKHADLPKTVDVVYGDNQERYSIPVNWDQRGNAETVWKLPPGAKRGIYHIELGNFGISAYFRVSDFRLPVFKAEVILPKSPLVAPRTVPLNLRLSYLSGGGAGTEKVTLRQRFAPARIAFPAYPDHLFGDSIDRWSRWFAERENEEQSGANGEGKESAAAGSDQSLTLEPEGTARATISLAKPVTQPRTLLADMEYRDPNGETYTSQARATLWPASRVVGIKTDYWAAEKGKTSAELLVLDTNGKPVADAPVAATASIRTWIAHRKRSVGGFYSYHQEETKDELGQVCAGTTDKAGKFSCVIALEKSGELLLRATTTDAQGRESRATTSLWAYVGDDSWFRADDHDRVDLLPEKKHYEPGETARLQLRMPFREATVLVAVMRGGGVLDYFVRQVSRKDPMIELPVKPGYAPNVYVSAFLVRGRVASPAPTALVDLARPAFKLGIAEFETGARKHQMKVSVSTDKSVYQSRDKAHVRIKVEGAVDGGGRRVLPAERDLAVFAIDEALLELLPNDTWNALTTMLTKRHYGFNSATAQMQVVGKRHYGRKALPPGGSGGRSPTRELFDTLLLWQGKVKVNDSGEAEVDVPLNDSLTRFRIVAVADAGPDQFGMGYASITANKDLQLLSGLPALVRDGDHFSAHFTARNTTARVMHARAWGTAGNQPLVEQTLELAPGEAKGVAWQVSAPTGLPTLEWRVNLAENQGRGDAIKIVQNVEPALTTAAFLSTSFELKGNQNVPLHNPPDAAPNRSTVLVSVAPKLGASAASVREYMRAYPFACLEQRTSKAVALRDNGLWAIISSGIERYMDENGLVKYYPGTGGEGYDVLTAFVLSASKEAGWELTPASRDKMLYGLTQFVNGRLANRHDYYRNDAAELTERKLLALDALSRFGQARPEMADSLKLDPKHLSTRALVEWAGILQRTKWPRRDTDLKAALAELQQRYAITPDGMHFRGNVNDDRWWLMYSDDVTAVKLLLLALNTPELAPNLEAFARGALKSQHEGHWRSTQANVWGALALDKYAEHVSKSTLGGKTLVRLGKEAREVNWAQTPMGDSFKLPLAGDALTLEHQGNGAPFVTVVGSAFAPLKSAMSSQAAVSKSMVPVHQAKPGIWSDGDVIKVKLAFVLNRDAGWLVLSDPIPAGSTILGGGLKGLGNVGATESAPKSWDWRRRGPVFDERTFGVYRAYYEYLPRGEYALEYELRLNNRGRFQLPPTHLEAMYAPDIFADMPNPDMEVK